jgi:hypothetical protein
MYAIKGNSWRSISAVEDAAADETVVDELPQALVDSTSLRANDATLENIRQQSDNALGNLRAYRDLASPTNAQTIAVVKLLCSVCIMLIRLQLRKLDAVD